MKHLNDSKGFSLVEMAVALLVMAVMAGIIYIASAPMRAESKTRSATEQLQQLETALAQYEGKNNGYPTSLTQAGFVTYLPVAPDTTYWNYACDATSSRVQWVAPDDAQANLVGAEWKKTLGSAGVTITLKSGTTPPSVTGVFKSGANCIATP